MKHIKSIIEKFLINTNYSRKSKDDKIFEKWLDIDGENTAKITKPFKIHNKKLFIYVENSVIMGEIVYEKKDIMAKINAEMGVEAVTNLIFRIKQ